MTLPVTKNVVQYKFEYVNDRKTDQLIRLVPGLTPLYDNVEKFRKSALAAYGCDFKNEKRMLHYQQTKGKVISTNLIEETLVRGKKTKRVKATVSVMQSKLWCSDGIHKIQDVLLVHELNKITTYASTRRTRSQIIPAKLYNISNFGHTTCEVTLVAAVRRGSFIEEGQEMMLIPKPPAYEKNSLRHTFTRWKKVVDRRISPPRKLSGSIIASNYCRDTVWENGLELYSVYLVHVNVERKPVWQYLKSRLADCYVGAEAELLVSIGPKKLCTLHTIRIVSIYDPTEVNVGELQTPINTIPLAVSFVVVLNGAQIVDIGSDCTMAVWVIASSLYSLETHHGQLNIAAGAEDYFDDDNFVEQSDNDSDQQDWTEKKSVFLTFDTKYVFVHEDKSLPGQSTDDLRLILDEWCSEPDYSIPFLDFLLVLPKGTLVTRVGNFDETCMNKVSVQRLLQRLDESQKKAVETMLRWKLSITQGPPGSGKTLMLGYGVAILRSISEGLIIVCTQSNCAADEAYEKIASVNRQFKLGIRVLRMLGQKRERVDSQKETPSTERPYFLHERVRSHYKWVRDEEINDIIEKEIYEGATALTLDEANKLRGHLMRVTRTVLLRTDVVVCTVACASDYRLKSTLDIMRKIKRPLSALILDESSLLTVPATLPILTFNPLRVWLIGDDKQLRLIID
ncbi:unnamed protein product [Orchesella dallaii]|uniref:DNA2/NAM7 helicase helicase domain-containing protein n=1 Tax=Orchesella dallaii TaxID=48710 RepID=A0ABP1Q8S9_9HEXA